MNTIMNIRNNPENKAMLEAILEALLVRELCEPDLDSEYQTIEPDQTQQLRYYMSVIASEGGDEAVADATAQLKEGSEYYNMGYRIKKTGRRDQNLSIEVPRNALAWKLQSAGYEHLAQQHQIVYIIKV